VDVAYDTMGGMTDLVRRLDEELPEGTKLVPNRGFTIFQYISQYVDGIMFESFSTTYDETSGFFVDRNESDMEYNQTVACNIINRVRRYDYMPVFCLDYINKAEYTYMPQNVYDNAWMYDFVPYCTYSRQLDICPNPGVKPASARGSLALSKLNDSTGETTLNGDTSSANLVYAGNELCTVTVDSTFVGYSGAKPLTDGFIATEETHNQMNWATESWASENNNRKDHWIQFTFTSPQDISKVNVYWAPDGTGTPTFYSAREARVEAMIDGKWTTVATYSWKKGEEYLTQQLLTEFTFDKITTDQIRIFQPKGMGDATSSRTDGVETLFTGIMWVSEVEIYA
ncbi:MAG: discoidin domain-containing protein, partial [Clostridia bacterium]|nr:discoidin domain-containing protein [Clostridia bacterium]